MLCYLLGGQLNREIAAELGVSERTIKVHRGRVMEKLVVQSTAQLFPMVLRVLRDSGCKILEDIKELGRETAASNRRQKTPTLEQGLAIQEFLKKQRRAKARDKR